MAEAKALPFRAATDGESVSGKFTGTVQLTRPRMIVPEDLYFKIGEEVARETMPDIANMSVAGIKERAETLWNIVDFMGPEYYEDCSHLERGVLMLAAIRERHRTALGAERDTLRQAFEKTKEATEEMISRRRARRQRARG